MNKEEFNKWILERAQKIQIENLELIAKLEQNGVEYKIVCWSQSARKYGKNQPKKQEKNIEFLFSGPFEKQSFSEFEDSNSFESRFISGFEDIKVEFSTKSIDELIHYSKPFNFIKSEPIYCNKNDYLEFRAIHTFAIRNNYFLILVKVFREHNYNTVRELAEQFFISIYSF